MYDFILQWYDLSMLWKTFQLDKLKNYKPPVHYRRVKLGQWIKTKVILDFLSLLKVIRPFDN